MTLWISRCRRFMAVEKLAVDVFCCLYDLCTILCILERVGARQFYVGETELCFCCNVCADDVYQGWDISKPVMEEFQCLFSVDDGLGAPFFVKGDFEKGGFALCYCQWIYISTDGQ